MKTILEKAYSNNEINLVALKKAANILKQGGLVAFPTETVYGLGANAFCEESVKKIFFAKGRPSDNPLIVHISDLSQVDMLAKNISKQAKVIINKFWPGPLTLVLKKSDLVLPVVSGSLDTVAVRFSSNDIAKKLIDLAGVPIAAPSANISGSPSPTLASHVFKDLKNKVDFILDGGLVKFGIESTVLDVSSDCVTILRPGSITKNMLEEVVEQVFFDKTLLKNEQAKSPKSPGMKYKHYAPNASLIIVKGDKNNVKNKIIYFVKNDLINKKNPIIITTKQTNSYYTNFKTIVIGDLENLQTISSNLFNVLRECDNLNATNIYIEALPEIDLGFSIMNRLKKAAGYNIINV